MLRRYHDAGKGRRNPSGQPLEGRGMILSRFLRRKA